MNWNKLLIAKNNLYLLLVCTISLLLIPLIAMQFSNEVFWKIGDFIAAEILLMGSGYLYLVLTKYSSSKIKNGLFAIGVLAGLIIVWATLAVDLI